MNVWIVNHYAIPPSMGGLVRHYYFSKYLQKKGHNVKIFTSSKVHNTDINMIADKSLFVEKMMDDIEYTFVRSKDYKGNGIDRIINMIDLPFQMWKAMKVFYKNSRPDVIYTSSPDLFVSFCAILFGKMRKIPVVVEVRDLWPESIVEYNGVSGKNPIILTLYKLEKWIYKNAKCIIFTMPGGKEYICDKGWDKTIDLNKIYHINNGVDLDEFESNRRLYAFSDEDLDDENSYKVIYMGSIRLVNNIGQLVDASRILKEKGYNHIQILVYGDGTEKEQLEQACKKENLNVKFKGRVEKRYVPYILSKADINIINVKESGLIKYGCSWNKLFEYIASGKAILSNLPAGKYDLIANNQLGISKFMKTSEEYADEIIRLLNRNQKEIEATFKRSCEVKNTYDYKVLTEALEKILKDI